MKQLTKWMLAAILICGAATGLASCEDIFGHWERPTAASDQLKQGIWTEYDEALVNSGKYTVEQLAQMPTVGMQIDGDKAYFFTYTAYDMSEAVEGKVSYNKAKNAGTITFPAIKDNPLSGQSVNFSMMADDLMQFELTYEGQQTTATFAWLCEDLDNWSSDITDEDWLALMAYYETIAAEAGPDASIDWSDSDVEGLDEPLVWDEGDVAQARTRTVGMGAMVVMNILGSLFGEEQYDPKADIQEIKNNLNKITGKLDEVLKGQKQMMNQMNLQFDKLNDRLNAIAKKMDQQEAMTALNNRNTTYYNKLKGQNTAHFDDAYKLYNENKDDLSKVSTQLGQYGEAWAGDGNKYVDLTWEYIEYLTTVQHSTYGTGMGKIYDGLTFDKYPWEHMGTGDRLAYRAYDIFMITKSLFMITLYASYCDISDVKKNGIYKNYINYIEQLKGFCEFNVTNPDEFLVCQIPGAHFVMHKELQKYNYKGKNNEAPHPAIFGQLAVYRPEWHEAGSITIENPTELQSKLIHPSEMRAIYNYYKSADKAFADKNYLLWKDILVSYQDNKLVAGAKFSQEPGYFSYPYLPVLMLYEPDLKEKPINGVRLLLDRTIQMGPDTQWAGFDMSRWSIGDAEIKNGKAQWTRYEQVDYYAAIVEKRY
jgi:hypothetical protein